MLVHAARADIAEVRSISYLILYICTISWPLISRWSNDAEPYLRGRSATCMALCLQDVGSHCQNKVQHAQ